MAKKMFLNRERIISSAQVSSVRREEPDTEIASSSIWNNPVSEKQLPFKILDETSKSFPKFNATGRSLFIKFNSPGEEQEPTAYLKECITAITDYLVDEVPDRDLVGLRIRNTENVQDKVVGISLRRRDQLKPDVVWAVLGKVIQSNARFGLSDRLEVHLDHVRMPVGNGREKTNGRSLGVLSAIKKSIFVVKAAFLCMAHALVIAMARVNSDPKYESYRHGRCLNIPVEELLKALVLIYPMAEALKNFSSFKTTFRIIKLLCLMDLALIGSFSVEIPIRTRNCTCFMIRTMGTIT